MNTVTAVAYATSGPYIAHAYNHLYPRFQVSYIYTRMCLLITCTVHEYANSTLCIVHLRLHVLSHLSGVPAFTDVHSGTCQPILHPLHQTQWRQGPELLHARVGSQPAQVFRYMYMESTSHGVCVRVRVCVCVCVCVCV